MLFLYLHRGDLWKSDLYFRMALFRGIKYLTALKSVADMFHQSSVLIEIPGPIVAGTEILVHRQGPRKRILVAVTQMDLTRVKFRLRHRLL